MKSNENGKSFLIHGNFKSNFVFSFQTFFIAKFLESISTFFVSRADCPQSRRFNFSEMDQLIQLLLGLPLTKIASLGVYWSM